MKFVAVRSAFRQIKTWPTDYRIISSFCLGVGISIFNAAKYCNFSSFIGQKVHMLESYVIIGSTGSFFIGVLLGNLLLLSDAPFVNQLTIYEIAAIGKKEWIKSRIIYLLITSFIYISLVVFSTIVFSLLVCGITFENEWSISIKQLAEKQPQFASISFGISFPYPNYINHTSPYLAFILTLLYNWAYMALIGLIILCVNLLTNQNIGWIIAISIHIAGYIIYANGGFYAPLRFSPFCWALPAIYFDQMSKMSFVITFCLFSVFVTGQIDMCMYALKKYEL